MCGKTKGMSHRSRPAITSSRAEWGRCVCTPSSHVYRLPMICTNFCVPLPPLPKPLQASILDLHSGALSMGKQFVNIYRWGCSPCLVCISFGCFLWNRTKKQTLCSASQVKFSEIYNLSKYSVGHQSWCKSLGAVLLGSSVQNQPHPSPPAGRSS